VSVDIHQRHESADFRTSFGENGATIVVSKLKELRG
jgi:hypothetical protein